MFDKKKNDNSNEENGVTDVFRPAKGNAKVIICLLYTSPSPRDRTRSRMPSSA